MRLNTEAAMVAAAVVTAGLACPADFTLTIPDAAVQHPGATRGKKRGHLRAHLSSPLTDEGRRPRGAKGDASSFSDSSSEHSAGSSPRTPRRQCTGLSTAITEPQDGIPHPTPKTESKKKLAPRGKRGQKQLGASGGDLGGAIAQASAGGTSDPGDSDGGGSERASGQSVSEVGHTVDHASALVESIGRSMAGSPTGTFNAAPRLLGAAGCGGSPMSASDQGDFDDAHTHGAIDGADTTCPHDGRSKSGSNFATTSRAQKESKKKLASRKQRTESRLDVSKGQAQQRLESRSAHRDASSDSVSRMDTSRPHALLRPGSFARSEGESGGEHESVRHESGYGDTIKSVSFQSPRDEPTCPAPPPRDSRRDPGMLDLSPMGHEPATGPELRLMQPVLMVPPGQDGAGQQCWGTVRSPPAGIDPIGHTPPVAAAAGWGPAPLRRRALRVASPPTPPTHRSGHGTTPPTAPPLRAPVSTQSYDRTVSPQRPPAAGERCLSHHEPAEVEYEPVDIGPYAAPQL
eukprot:gene32766-65363_t